MNIHLREDVKVLLREHEFLTDVISSIDEGKIQLGLK